MIGLSETKTDECDAINLPGYSVFFKNRCKLSKVRSGGIAVLVKDHIVKYTTVINTESPYVLWLRISKSLFNLDKDVCFGIIYIPPEGSKYS